MQLSNRKKCKSLFMFAGCTLGSSPLLYSMLEEMWSLTFELTMDKLLHNLIEAIVFLFKKTYIVWYSYGF